MVARQDRAAHLASLGLPRELLQKTPLQQVTRSHHFGKKNVAALNWPWPSSGAAA